MDIQLSFLKAKGPGSSLYLPGHALKSLNISKGNEVTLHCGSAKTRVRVKLLSGSDQPENIAGLTTSALQAPGIPPSVSFKIKPLKSNHFRLGPVIGIMTFPGHVPDRLRYYYMYAKRNKNNGLLFVFRGRGIDEQTKTITGYYYDRVKKKWKEGTFPYPDTIIDRCYPNPYKAHTLLENVIGPGKIFNKRSMIDKVQFAKSLDADPYLRQFIPETKVFENDLDAEQFLKKHGQIFLKPVNAMKGLGIVAASETAAGEIQCLYTVSGENYTVNITSVNDIPNILVKAMGYERPYIVQQAIQRMKYQDGPFSIRTWAMKNGQGRWVMPGMFAKGALGEGFLTNFTAGAKLIPLKELFKAILPSLPYTRAELLKLLKNITLRTAACLDKSYGPLVELGLDIVFDVSGKPWLIEANGNPGNIPIFKQKEYPEWPHQVFQYPLDYATFLAGFAT